jgi:hypothetical protein
LADIAENTAGIWELHERALVTKPVPNFTRLDPGRPDIAILMNAMLRAREVAAVRARASGAARMHGGPRGSGGPQGNRNGNFKHGVWTRENVETRRAVRAHIREAWIAVRLI